MSSVSGEKVPLLRWPKRRAGGGRADTRQRQPAPLHLQLSGDPHPPSALPRTPRESPRRPKTVSVWSTTAAQPKKPPERALRPPLPGSRARWHPQPEFQAPIPYSQPPGVPHCRLVTSADTVSGTPLPGTLTRQAYHRDPVFPAHWEGKASSSWVWAAFLGNAESGQSLKARVALVVETHVFQP